MSADLLNTHGLTTTPQLGTLMRQWKERPVSTRGWFHLKGEWVMRQSTVDLGVSVHIATIQNVILFIPDKENNNE